MNREFLQGAWWLARLKEPSSWRGLVWLLTAAGVTLDPEAMEYLVALGMAAAGLLGMVMSDRRKTETP